MCNLKEKLKVVFLDYDGVVNVPMWNEEGTRCEYAWPKDNKVNCFQACQWVSEFCQKFGYKIVVTSTWRSHDNYIDCLYNGGLRKNIEVIGKTPHLHKGTRTDEIKMWLNEHPEVDDYIIFDDDIIEGLEHKQILCGCYGFDGDKYEEAMKLIGKFSL